MAFIFYIQTARDIETTRQKTQLEHDLFNLLNAWEVVADFQGDKSDMKIAFVEDQPHHSIIITIPFVGLPDEKIETNLEMYIQITFGLSLRSIGCTMISILLSEDRHSVPANNSDGGFDYCWNLDYLPKRPLHAVAKKADALLQETKCLQSQIGSHTNGTVMTMIHLKLDELKKRYQELLPSKEKLKNFSQIKNTLTKTIKNHDAQQTRLKTLSHLNKAKNPATCFSKDHFSHLFGFLTLREMHTVLLLISHGWTHYANIAITARLASKLSKEPLAQAEFKQPNISLVRDLCSDLRREALTRSELNLDVAQKLTTFGFERLHPYIKVDIMNHPQEVNELMARDSRYCLFFAKLVACIADPNASGVKWAYAQKEQIAKLLQAEPHFVELILSNRYTGLVVATLTENVDLLLDDLKKIGMSLKDFMQDASLCKLFWRGFVTLEDPDNPFNSEEANLQPWIDYVEAHTVPQKTTSPAP